MGGLHSEGRAQPGQLAAQRKRTLGEAGEDAAAAYLQRHYGFRVIARNWRNPFDQREEIDLVCRDGRALVFVEVKTRAPGALVTGFSAVGFKKKRVLKRAIQAFLRFLHPSEQPHTTRCDVVEVEFSFEAPPVCRLYENVSLRTPKPFR